MTVDAELINKLEALSKIRLRESEREDMQNELVKMLSLMDSLSSLDDDGGELLRFADNASLRADEVIPSALAGELLSAAAEVTDGCYSVPTAVE